MVKLTTKLSYHSHENEDLSLSKLRASQCIFFHIYNASAICHPQSHFDISVLLSHLQQIILYPYEKTCGTHCIALSVSPHIIITHSVVLLCNWTCFICVSVCCTCEWRMCMFVHILVCVFGGQRRMSGIFLYHLPTWFPETKSLPEAGADRQTAGPRDPPVSWL